MGGPDIIEELQAALGADGLSVRGVAWFSGEEGPLGPDGRPLASVVLIGNTGGGIWPEFSRWRDRRPDRGGADPLDRWSKKVIDPLAERYGAKAFYPSDQPYQPFQQWAKRAEGLMASPLGMLIHPVFGLWHGYRGALGFIETLPGHSADAATTPCAACVAKPCLTTCPVSAIEANGFDVAACRAHLVTPAGQAGCMVHGCVARNACPVGAGYRYPPEQLRFHMAALFS
jgi:hypothetical protein